MPELPVYRRKGFQIFDDDGNHICDVANDIIPNSYYSLGQFTNWSIPELRVADVMHPAILKAVDPNYYRIA